MARRSASPGPSREPFPSKRLRLASVAAVSCAVAAGGYALTSRGGSTPSASGTPAFVAITAAAIEPAPARPAPALLPLSAAGLGWAIDPAPISGRVPKRFAQAKPLSAAWVPARTAAPEKFAAASIPTLKPTLQPAPAPTIVEIARVAAPLPIPRPGDLRGAQNPVAAAPTTPVAAPTVTAPTAVAEAPAPASPRRTSRRSQRMIAAAPVPVDTRNFLEKLFGLPASTGPATTYASLGGALPAAPAPSWSPIPSPSAGGLTAIYDISARTVTLPSGEVLEAHSGLGAKMDDPRFAHVRMQGVTPPGTYDLTEREKLFHGVRAIRMNPVGGSAAIHGRDGILAHTYMLGASGQSNGCVSFRDYNRFLQAFLSGQVRRIVVVPGGRGSALPSFAQGEGRGSRA